METFDVIVMGGGPAGMMAAGHAAEYGRKVVLLEKNDRLGKKLELTGNGRCNITNAVFDTREFLANYGEAQKFLFSPFSRFAVQDTFDFFSSHDLPLYVSEDRNRAFPKSDDAQDVTRVLQDNMKEHGVDVRFKTTVKKLLLENGTLTGVETNQGTFQAESVIIATGGASYKETGSTGEGLNWLKDLGHSVAEATPDIVPLKVKEPWVKALSGTSFGPMKITFSAKNGEKLSKTGNLLFTHFGISGPLILNSANEVKKLLKQGPVNTTIDLFPKEEMHEVDRRILELFDSNKNKIVRNTLKPLTPPGTTKALAANLPEELLSKKVNAVTQEERKALARKLKALPFTVTGTMGYDWAVVCDGGVPLTEIDTRTMASKIYPNLFIIGDLLHISRPSGGFSLQLCWTTGWVAGESA